MAILAAASIATTALSSVLGFKSNRAKKRAAKLRAQMVMMQNARERRDLIRDFRGQRAQAMAAGTYQPGMGIQSSSTQGAVSSLGAQTQGGLNYIAKSASLNQAAVKQELKADSLATAGNIVGAVGEVVHGFAVARGSYDTLAQKIKGAF